MLFGNMPRDGGHLCLSPQERADLLAESSSALRFIYRYVGAQELIHGKSRYCLWIEDDQRNEAEQVIALAARFRQVEKLRQESPAPSTRSYAKQPHRFVQIQATAKAHTIVVPTHTSENREFLPIDLLDATAIISNAAFAIYDAPLWNVALIASKLHLVWIATVCGKIKTDFRYSNTLGWNTFPVPDLTEQNRVDLTRCAEDILLAREAHFPATIADLYDLETMPANLRAAHDANDEVLDRIYIGRRFRNDTERLEKLFEMYAKMTATGAGAGNTKRRSPPVMTTKTTKAKTTAEVQA
jgi:hypothetical protein